MYLYSTQVSFMRDSKLQLLYSILSIHSSSSHIHHIHKNLVSVLVSKINTSLPNSLRQGLFTFPNPNSGVVLLLVGLVGSFGVTDLRHEVVFLGEDKVSDTGQVGELSVGIDVHLDNTVDDSSLDFLLGRSRSTVED